MKSSSVRAFSRVRHFAVFATAVVLIAAVVHPAAGAGRDDAAQAVLARLRSIEPRGSDYTAASLKKYQQTLLSIYDNDRRAVPLDVKAHYYEWVLRRYHLTAYHQVHTRIILPEKPGVMPNYYYGEDNSTWNGALLAALSYQYAVTKDPETLRLIGRLLEGLHLFLEVTGNPGVAARCVLCRETPFADAVHRHISSDGTVYYFRSDAAKGTYNQLVGGYATLMMHAFDDLPEDQRQLARDDMLALVLHLVDNDYRLKDLDGSRTSYGNLTPLVGTLGVPFNAQVAYMIVAAGTYFPPEDPAIRERIRRQFKRLRTKHHVYYENPLTHLVCPQRVGDNPLVKGMNDRNHVVNAAFIGLNLEIESARRRNVEPDEEFLYQLGRTMFWAMHRLQHQHNALCNFMWAGLLSDKKIRQQVVPFQEDRMLLQRDYIVAAGIEQLRRFPVDRFYYPGRKVKTYQPQLVDARKRHDNYLWKSGPFDRWEITGPSENVHTCSIDYLYAYWLMRYYRLDERRELFNK